MIIVKCEQLTFLQSTKWSLTYKWGNGIGPFQSTLHLKKISHSYLQFVFVQYDECFHGYEKMVRVI